MRWTKVVGGAIMGSLFILIGIELFAWSQSQSINLLGLPNIFGVLCLLILPALGMVMIVLPVLRKILAKLEGTAIGYGG